MNVPEERKEKVPKDESVDRIERKILKGRIKRMHGAIYFGKGKHYFYEIQKKERRQVVVSDERC